VHLDDFVVSIAADHEISTLTRLTAGASRADLAALESWVRVRRAALRTAVYEFPAFAPGNPLRLTPEQRDAMTGTTGVPDRLAPAAAEAVIEWLRSVMAAAEVADRVFVRLATAEEQRGTGGSQVAYQGRVAIRRLADRRRRVAGIIADLLRAERGERTAAHEGVRTHEHLAAPVPLVGRPGTAMRLDGFLPWAAPYFGLEPSAGPLDDPSQRQARSAFREALQHCRRYPAPKADADAAPTRHAFMRALVDCVDGLMALVDSQPDAWTRATVRRSSQILGTVARDAAAFDAVLTHVTPDDDLSPALRRRIVVAGGLIGAPGALAAAERLIAPPLEGSIKRAVGVSDGDIRAAALAAALVGPESLSAFLRYAEAALPPAAFTERFSKLRKRACRGLLLSLGGLAPENGEVRGDHTGTTSHPSPGG